MAKAMIKTSARERKEKRASDILLVREALEQGLKTRGDICKATGMKTWELSNLFSEEESLYAAYTVRRRTLVDTAADNIQDIIDDKDHPQHFQASKYVLQNYKSDLDSILDSKDEKEIIVDINPKSTTSPVTIRFGKRE